IVAGELFTINVVGEHERNYLKHFWSGYSPDKNPFSEIDYEVSQNGGIIIKAAKSVLECRKVDEIEPGDHKIIIAQVHEGHILNDQAKPYIHLRKSGLDY